MTEEIASLHEEVRKLRGQIDSNKVNQKNKKAVSRNSKTKPVMPSKIKMITPKLSEFKKNDIERISKKYQMNRFEIQQQTLQSK